MIGHIISKGLSKENSKRDRGKVIGHIISKGLSKENSKRDRGKVIGPIISKELSKENSKRDRGKVIGPIISKELSKENSNRDRESTPSLDHIQWGCQAYIHVLSEGIFESRLNHFSLNNAPFGCGPPWGLAWVRSWSLDFGDRAQTSDPRARTQGPTSKLFISIGTSE